MNGQILRLGGDEHDIVQLLLPWCESAHLDAAQAARIQAHLGVCIRCQSDLAWQRRLRGIVAADPDAFADCAKSATDVDQGWSALRKTLSTMQASQQIVAAPLSKPARRRRPAFASRWLMALQSTVIVALAAIVVAMLLPRPEPYRALGQPTHASDASIVVVFRADATEAQIRQSLRDSDARLVDGPTATGAYLLSVAPARHADALARLRGASIVLRVESLAAEAVQ